MSDSKPMIFGIFRGSFSFFEVVVGTSVVLSSDTCCFFNQIMLLFFLFLFHSSFCW